MGSWIHDTRCTGYMQTRLGNHRVSNLIFQPETFSSKPNEKMLALGISDGGVPKDDFPKRLDISDAFFLLEKYSEQV
jgi:hypothetical protein